LSSFAAELRNDLKPKVAQLTNNNGF